ncbi:MAG: hypothetical protein QG628_805 [Patescibacteria group bacterium]|nr:hypothetical protein [Patescibacteria group bacterium]
MISGGVLAPIGFIVMIVSLLNLYGYSSKDCSLENSCNGLDIASYGVRIGIVLFLVGIILSIISGMVFLTLSRKTK